jgi:hypothetical protein
MTRGFEAFENPYMNAAAKFVDPGEAMDMNDQLVLLRHISAEFGRPIPRLDDSEAFGLRDKLEAAEGLRVLPTFIPLRISNRFDQLRPKPTSALARFLSPDLVYSPLDHSEKMERETDKPFGQLWQDGGPRRIDKEPFQYILKAGVSDFGIVHRLPSGELVDHQTYLNYLIDNGHAKPPKHNEQGAWTYPVIDVSDKVHFSGKDSENHFSNVDFIVTAEAIQNAHLMHLLAGSPKNEDITEYANEAVYELGNRRQAINFLGTTGVTWSVGDLNNRLRHAWWSKGNSYRDGQVPEAFTGI